MSGGPWTRRRCALLGLSALAGALVSASTRVSAAAGSRRWIELKNLHTGEVLKATFDRDAGPDPETLAKLQHQLRDYRINEEHAMDAALYGLLSDLAEVTGHEARYEVISGYRSPRTNAKLHAEGHGVAEHSLHMEGRAIDVRLLGCDLETFRDAALKAGRGGVGYYPSSNFVHIDTGRVRRWTGR
ncbi:MAG TPA: YcbK family protein [Steroidobacteraceae bacterium]|jgi:uncharacterized protein YcbK (DUF882 family)|nr:YcbK family protein [Steroidobacteraceae bacterium]